MLFQTIDYVEIGGVLQMCKSLTWQYLRGLYNIDTHAPKREHFRFKSSMHKISNPERYIYIHKWTIVDSYYHNVQTISYTFSC